MPLGLGALASEWIDRDAVPIVGSGAARLFGTHACRLLCAGGKGADAISNDGISCSACERGGEYHEMQAHEPDSGDVR